MQERIDITPRGVSGCLLLRPMPGGAFWPDLDEGLALLRTLDRVVVLVPDEELAIHSRAYWRWLRDDVDDAPTIVRFPIVDWGLPTEADAFFACARDVQAALARGERVLVHCWAGVGRSGTFAMAVLVEHGYSLDQAEPLVRAAGGSPEGRQYEWVRAEAVRRHAHARRDGG